MTVVGSSPRDLGRFDLNPTEMMFWLYLPISLPGDGSQRAGVGYGYQLPPNLQQFSSLVHAICFDDGERFRDSYVYLTAKTLWVEGGYIGNRPGWHCDGFGTEDVNYIWCDRAPTEFYTGCFRVSDDCAESMVEMENYGKTAEALRMVHTYPDKHLLRLDPTVVHRSPAKFEPGMRTFVKVSLSKDRYDLVGNSINHSLPFEAPRIPRKTERNHPASVTA